MDSFTKGSSLDLAIVAMPCWTVKQPPHSLAIVGSIAKASGLRYEVHDLNILFYRHVAEEEKKIWDDSVINLWVGDVAERLWKQHERWLHAHLDTILKRAPSMVAFTVNMWTRHFSVRAANYIKSRSKETTILFGGVDCFVGEYNKKFLDDGACDIICQGEAEVAFRAFLSKFKEQGWRTDVPGFAYRNANGELIDTGRAALPSFRDPQPPHIYDAFDLSLYLEPGRIPFFFSRGCPFSCRFCSETANFGKFRSRNPDEAFAELVAILPVIKDYAKVPVFDFSDSIFNANIKALLQFANLIINNDLNVTIGVQGHFHHTMTKEVIDTLARAGFKHIFWGFESGSQKVIDLMNKAYRLTDAIRIMENCSAAGISQHLPVLVGFPGEEAEDFAETVEFIIRYRNTPGLHFFQPSPVLVRTNAELHDRYMDFGLANNEVLQWKDLAENNTYRVRLSRCFVASQAQGNPDLLRESLVCSDYLAFDINEHPVAKDLYKLLNDLFARTNGAAAFADHIHKMHVVANRPSVKLKSLFGTVPGKYGLLGLTRSLIVDPARFQRIARFIRRRLLASTVAHPGRPATIVGKVRGTLTKLIQNAQFGKTTENSSTRPGSSGHLSETAVVKIASSRADIARTGNPSCAAQTADPLMEQWLGIDKNRSEVREVLYAMTLDALNRLTLKHQPVAPTTQLKHTPAEHVALN